METSVEWLFKQLWDTPKDKLDWNILLKMAEEKHKKEIVNAVNCIQIVNRYYYKNGEFGDDLLGKEITTGEERTYYGLSKTGEQYYNEVFKSEGVNEGVNEGVK